MFKIIILTMCFLAHSLMAKTLPDLRFNLVELASENKSGFTHAVFFPEYFAAHSFYSTAESRADDSDWAAMTFAVSSLAAVAAVSPDAAAISSIFGMTEGVGEAFDPKHKENVAASEFILREVQNYYASKETSVDLDALISFMGKIANQKFETEEAVERLSLVASKVKHSDLNQ